MVLVNKFVVCFDAETGEIFAVDEVFLVEHKYRKNFYRVDFRLNFRETDVNLLESAEMRKVCFQHIMERMTTDKLWKSRDSFYVITYKVRLLKETLNEFLGQQKVQEVYNRLQYAGDSDSSQDSAYITLSHESLNISLEALCIM